MAEADQAWEYGPEKVSVAWKGLAIDLTLYGSSELTGRIECVEVGLRSIPESRVPRASTEVITGSGGAPILATHFREPGLRLATRIDAERRQLRSLLRRLAAAELSTASRRFDAQTGRSEPITEASIQRQRNRNRNRQMADAAGSQTANRPWRSIDRALLQEVGAVYRKHAIQHRDPARAVARHFDRPQSTTDKWIRAARKRGYLQPVSEED